MRVGCLTGTYSKVSDAETPFAGAKYSIHQKETLEEDVRPVPKAVANVPVPKPVCRFGSVGNVGMSLSFVQSRLLMLEHILVKRRPQLPLL